MATLTAAIAAAAMTLCARELESHETQRLSTITDAAALSYVRAFMTEFTTPDPFRAHDYTERIVAQATGDFAQQYRQNQNAILVQVAGAEPAKGTVPEAGVSRQNDDGSVDVLAATKVTSKSPDGTLQLERTNRWTTTAKQEGDLWKISELSPMT